MELKSPAVSKEPIDRFTSPYKLVETSTWASWYVKILDGLVQLFRNIEIWKLTIWFGIAWPELSLTTAWYLNASGGDWEKTQLEKSLN